MPPSATNIIQYMKEHNINAYRLIFNQSCHSVAEAALAVNASPEDFVKNICFIDDSKSNDIDTNKNNNENNNNDKTANNNNETNDTTNLIVAIIKGEDKADANKIASYLKIPKPKIATPEQILEKTGYPCGGTPSFGYKATFLIDTRVMEKEFVYTGGGTQTSLIKISTKELLKANSGQIAEVRK